jgi:hypothetical protein
MSFDQPRIWKGSGRLSAVAFNRQQAASKFVGQQTSRLERTMSHPTLETPGRGYPYFFARITSASAISGKVNRWSYGFEEIRYNTSTKEWEAVAPIGTATAPVGLSGTAISAIEGGNDGAVVMPGVEITNIPPGFEVKPLEVGCPVLILTSRAMDGTVQFVISPLPNAIDGACE